MAFSYKEIKEELIKNKIADDGLVAWGQNVNKAGSWFGAIGGIITAMNAKKHTISIFQGNLIIIPLEKDKISYDKMTAYDKSTIIKAKIGGLGNQSYLSIVTKDKKTLKFNISQGKDDVKEMLKKLGL